MTEHQQDRQEMNNERTPEKKHKINGHLQFTTANLNQLFIQKDISYSL